GPAEGFGQSVAHPKVAPRPVVCAQVRQQHERILILPDHGLDLGDIHPHPMLADVVAALLDHAPYVVYDCTHFALLHWLGTLHIMFARNLQEIRTRPARAVDDAGGFADSHEQGVVAAVVVTHAA